MLAGADGASFGAAVALSAPATLLASPHSQASLPSSAGSSHKSYSPAQSRRQRRHSSHTHRTDSTHLRKI